MCKISNYDNYKVNNNVNLTNKTTIAILILNFNKHDTDTRRHGDVVISIVVSRRFLCMFSPFLRHCHVGVPVSFYSPKTIHWVNLKIQNCHVDTKVPIALWVGSS